jgi:Xaa-Pro aminopeptidase
MKKDLDDVMRENNVDALLVMGAGRHNPAMVYFTGVIHMTDGFLVKPLGAEPTLFHFPMEREEAKKSGLQTKSLDAYDLNEIKTRVGNDTSRVMAERLRMILADAGVPSGRVAVYGKKELGPAYAIIEALQTQDKGFAILGELEEPLLGRVMTTKDSAEVEHIRRMGKITTAVVARTADFLTSHPVQDEVLMQADGEPLTIGEVKRLINLWLAEYGVENPEDTIFSIGRDAGIPHNAGNPTDEIRLGKTIVFDIFPCEAGGGYYYDFTRTWSLGYAPEPVQALYDDVLGVYQEMMRSLEVGIACSKLQKRTCELFHAQGHPTVMEKPQIREGYVHSLGHGLGLHLHELPMFRHTAASSNRLDPGVIVTIEPGLYYPSKGMGVRLEDTVWVTPEGKFEVLADYPLDLVLPMKADL